ncbi:MAG TPA: FAD-binding oxidoreductase [Halobacteria archaeon]|nr:FAD-binding oxidoreductase [Halobacteria archaeon]
MKEDRWQSIVKDLKSIVGSDYVIYNKDLIERYLTDETADPVMPKCCTDVIVIKPGCVNDISSIMRYANENIIPVVVRGGGTGLCAGVVPIKPSIILSMERLNKILEIDEENLSISCEAGVTLREILSKMARVKGLFFPLHPGDEGSQVGGLVAENAGGSRAVKYGVMRNFVKGIKIVLPTGEIITLGGKVVKNNTGYDLMHLIIGSEGTLGIITEVTLRLIPEAGSTYTLIIPFKDVKGAIGVVPKILKSGTIPLAIEYIDKESLQYGEQAAGERWPTKEGSAHLMIIIEGRDEEDLLSISKKIEDICLEHGALDILVADTSKEQRKVLNIRSLIYEGSKDDLIEILDVSIPPAMIPDFVIKSKDAAREYKMTLLQFGHAADGNVHQEILKSGLEEKDWRERYPLLKQKIFQLSSRMGGYITAEHGIGLTKKDDMYRTLSKKEIDLMSRIKSIFDPNNILNPGKVIDIDTI